eukprot:symbB.v1.2.026995.t1/scaffold2736.1/size71972/4
MQITGRGSVFGRRWSLGSAADEDQNRRGSAKSSGEYRNRFEKGFTMVEEEELGIAFCTRAKMRRQKGPESTAILWLRWLFGKLSPESPQNTTWQVITSKQLSMLLKVSALLSFSTVMALVALEPICVESSEGPLFSRLGKGRDDGLNVVLLLHFLNSLMYLFGSITYHLHLIVMDEASVGVFDITLQFSGYKSTEAKTQERAAVVFQALCSYLVREVSIGRTVHVPNLGLFFHGGPGQMRFKVLEKLLPPEHRWDGPSPGVGPIAKLRVEKIAQNAGVHKDVAEEMLQTVVKDFWTAVQGSTEVDLDFPGVGTIKVKEKTLSFEPIGPTLRSTKVTAEHSMFSSTASELWKKMPRSQHELRSKEMTESFASPTSRIPPPDAPLPDAPEGAQVLSLRKSSSTPVLKPLHHESKMTGRMQVQFLKSFKDRKLASLKEDAETLSKRFTRQLPMSERLFPPMLDRCSRTRSALFRESVNRDHISNVIGSNYSPFSSRT